MGEHTSWAQPSCIIPNGLLPNEVASVTRVLDAERWSGAEARVSELIERIQPNKPSEECRNAVANYVQRLIMKCFSCQVFTFGSVPLKTYLPDGDIDMTAFSKNINLKDTWANEVRDMLENEEKSDTAEFHVKEVQYIQAEVKIIKCLVENIVVDISFDQLGGLCTLCFLEEIDNLIKQDHLFKRSIILIKAWCYYESRILGAHHGLISTYALETLVLYIFHVFNNSFAGPLEVLYRFLEFFSKFDWDNFCVSLWGPVPISSLPDMAVEPPRKDSGELLLSKLFLDACSSCYAVFPDAQESQGLPFVSKFFNVIDPLRTNNNLGRSVSKGNFYRIRSAFAFGAKKLASLLECPKDDLIAEVNKFFMNTWKRHGSSRHRPDAPSPDLSQLHLPSADFAGDSENLKSQTSSKMIETVGSPSGSECQSDGSLALHGISPQFLNTTSQPAKSMSRNNSNAVPHTLGQKRYVSHTSSRVTNHIGRSISSSEPVQADRSEKPYRPDFIINDHEGQNWFQFARTRSSPELGDTSTDVSSRGRRNKMSEAVKNQFASARLDDSGRRKNLGSEVSGSETIKSSNDPVSLKHTLSHQSVDAASDSNCTSNSYHDDGSFASTGEELASDFETLEMYQEEQDLVNMMASPMIHNFNRQVQMPMHFPLSPSVLASLGYSQRNLAGMLPGNIPLINPIPYLQGFASSQLPNYISNAGLGSNPDETIESGNESSTFLEKDQEDNDHDFWHDQDTVSTSGLNVDNKKNEMFLSDDRQLPSVGRFDSSSSSGLGKSRGSFMRGQHKFARENKGPEREDLSGTSHYHNSRSQDVYSTDRITNLRFMSTSQSSYSGNKTSSEISWDGSAKPSKSGRDKREWKLTSSSEMSLPYRNTKNGWYNDDSSSDHVSVPTDDDNRDWVSLSTMDTDLAEQSSGSSSLAHPQGHSHQLPCYGLTQVSGPDSVISIAPMLVDQCSQQRTGDASAAGPLTFYPIGHPVPFLTMLPVYNLPSESVNSDGSASHFDRDGRLAKGHLNPSDQNFDSAEVLERPEFNTSSGSKKNTSLECAERKPDILNSDFPSHWQNLLFGRFCQNTRHHDPVLYPSPVVVPPMYLPWEGPGRPLSANINLFTQIVGYGHRVVPVTPLQAGHSRPPSVYQHYRDEVPRYRGGTGTYLPNPKVSFRDRQSPSARNHRGSYNYDRNDHGDREGSWVSSKMRAAGRNHVRTQADKPSSRPDRFIANDNRAVRSWRSYRHEPVTSYQNKNSSFGSSGNMHGSPNMAYDMHPLPAVNSNSVSQSGPAVPSVVMLCSYNTGAGYGSTSSSEQLEFGSLGPVHLPGMSGIPQHSDGGPLDDVFDLGQGAYRGDSPCSSPDQPSSPQYQRSVG